jgi:hypothetical protein
MGGVVGGMAMSSRVLSVPCLHLSTDIWHVEEKERERESCRAGSIYELTHQTGGRQHIAQHNKSKRARQLTELKDPRPSFSLRLIHAIWFKCWDRSIISCKATLHFLLVLPPLVQSINIIVLLFFYHPTLLTIKTNESRRNGEKKRKDAELSHQPSMWVGRYFWLPDKKKGKNNHHRHKEN